MKNVFNIFFFTLSASIRFYTATVWPIIMKIDSGTFTQIQFPEQCFSQITVFRKTITPNTEFPNSFSPITFPWIRVFLDVFFYTIPRYLNQFGATSRSVAKTGNVSEGWHNCFLNCRPRGGENFQERKFFQNDDYWIEILFNLFKKMLPDDVFDYS